MNRVLIAVVVLLGACAPRQPRVQYQYVHPGMQQMIAQGTATAQQYQSLLNTDSGACDMEALRIPAGSPACTANPDPCAGRYGRDLTNCRLAAGTNPPTQSCNNYNVYAAAGQQRAMRHACMRSRGWVAVPIR